MKFAALFGLLILFFPVTLIAKNTPCKVDAKTLLFVGTPVEQASCLLRNNGKGGVLADEPAKLPKIFRKLIGQNIKFKKESLAKYLTEIGVSDKEIGGSLNDSLSAAELVDGTKIQALYFVIHDTSTPYLKDENFPDDINANPDWIGNNFKIWVKSPVAHIFINRLGSSFAANYLNEVVMKGFGTKFARDVLKERAKGLQLHFELHQPRRRDSQNKNPNNDLIAPTPGFAIAQYERLALLYIICAARRGNYLIPAFHSAVDAGIKDAHDDPQNFDLELFGKSIEKILKKLN